MKLSCRNRTADSLCGSAIGLALFFAPGIAHSGPCTPQIAQLQQQIKGIQPGPTSGPTYSQTLGAQLHKQPTRGDVEHAERLANKDADAALDHAKRADAAGNAAECTAALAKARQLYGLN